MPRRRSHEDIRLLVCCICFLRQKTLRKISEGTLKLIQQHVYKFFSPHNSSFPSSICNSCYNALLNFNKRSSNNKLPELVDYAKLSNHTVTRSKSNELCDCFMCQRFRINLLPDTIGLKKRGRPTSSNTDATSKRSSVSLRCDKCFSEIMRGKPHVCSKKTLFKNTCELVSSVPMLGEQVASYVIRGHQETGPDGDIKLKNLQGKPTVVYVKQDKRSNKSPLFTQENLIKMQNEINVSDNSLLKLLTNIRTLLGNKSVQPYVREFLTKINKSLEEWFSVTTCELEKSEKISDNKYRTYQVSRPVFHCQDVSEFLKYIISYKSLDPHETLVKVGLDGGGGFFKIVLNCIEMTETAPSNQPRKLHKDGICVHTSKDSSVKKTFILLIVADISETYNNVEKLLSLLNLHEIHHVISSDLKLCNILLGLQSHSATYPCLYCEETKPWNEPAPPRTLASLHSCYNNYNENGSKIKTAAKYYNVVHPPLIAGYLDDPIHHIIPPMELHLFLGTVNYLLDTLGIILGESFVMNFLRSQNIVRKSYRGGELEGNQCKKLLSVLDSLDCQIKMKHGPKVFQCIPVIETLRSFNNVVKACFSSSLDENYKEIIGQFTRDYKSLNISITPKVHIIMDHIVPFIEEIEQPLGIYSEQASESVHADFTKFWEKYKVKFIHNPSYNRQIYNACLAYNAKHLI